ncbi:MULTISPECIES: hypothetical protein [unclassified Vibrio]|uniref:hypothetical protein n=1 Tax=unclassified Vibrio TaxID=2614977 RepID=UPI0020A55802|nr:MULTISPECIES: hypothetical protein [unclassified Vibrio]ELA9201552.1 hypothetical protein [Vibrio alginolyticus]
MYQVIKNPEKNLVDILVSESNSSAERVIKYCKNRLIETTEKNLEKVIDMHLAKSKTIGCIYIPFASKNAENLALICVKRHILIADAKTEERVTFQSKDFPQVAYPLAVYQKFPHSKTLKKYLFEATRSKLNLSQREQAISFLADRLEETPQEIQSFIHTSPCPIRKVVKETVSINTDIAIDSVVYLHMGPFWHDNRSVYVVRAGTGVGKTHQALRMCKREKTKGRKTAIISNLVSVVKQHKPEKIKAAFYDEAMHEIENADHFSLTINALVNDFHYYKVAQSDTIVIDESEKVLQALFDPNVTYIPLSDKKIIRKRLADLLQNKSKKLIFMDADASDAVTSAYVREYRNENEEEVITVNFPTTAYNKIEAYIDELTLVQADLVANKLLSSNRQFIACDSRKLIEHLLRESGYIDNKGYACPKSALKAGILVVHSKVKEFEEQAAFLEKPNQEISKYRTVIVSPSLREGFDIRTRYCDEVIVLSRNVLQPLQLVQLARRLRKATKIRFAVSHSLDFKYDTSKLRFEPQGDEALAERLEREFDKRETLLKLNQPLALQETLKELGFDLTVQPISLLDVSHVSQSSISTAKERLEEIPKSRILSQAEYYQLSRSSALTIADEMAIERWRIADMLNISVEDVTKDVVGFHDQFEFKASQAFLRAAQGKSAKDSLESKLAIVVSAVGVEGLRVDGTFEIADSLKVYNSIITHKELLKGTFDKKYSVKFDSMEVTESKNSATTRLNDLLKRLGIEKGKPIGNKKNRRRPYQFNSLAKAALTKSESDR